MYFKGLRDGSIVKSIGGSSRWHAVPSTHMVQSLTPAPGGSIRFNPEFGLLNNLHETKFNYRVKIYIWQHAILSNTHTHIVHAQMHKIQICTHTTGGLNFFFLKKKLFMHV